MRNVGMIGLLVVLLVTVGLAQGRHEHKGKTKLSPEAKTALKEFHKNEVYPAKKALHDNFMGQLSAEDLAFVTAKRQESAALQAKSKAIHEKLRADKKAGKEVDRAAAMAPVREERKALVNSMRPFLEAQQGALDVAMKSLKANEETWRAKKKAIIEQHTTAEEQAKMKERRAKTKDRVKKGAKEHGISEEDRYIMKAARFVLWDGELKEQKARDGKKKRGAPKAE